jgi:hypothetical protein
MLCDAMLLQVLAKQVFSHDIQTLSVKLKVSFKHSKHQDWQ